MIEPEKSITKYLFWRWEYLRRNKQYIDDYNDVLRSNNGTIDLSPLFNIEQNKDNPSLNTVYSEKLLAFAKTYYIYPFNPAIKTNSINMLQLFVDGSLYNNKAPLVLCGSPQELKCSSSQFNQIGCNLVDDTTSSITIEFDINTDINILIQGLTAHYERHKASIRSLNYLLECCKKDVKDMTYKEYKYMTDCFKLIRQEYEDICDNFFLNDIEESDEEYYNKVLKTYISNNNYTIPRDDTSRLVGLWIWENISQNGGKHKSIIDAIEEFELLPIYEKLNLGRDPSYYLWLEKTQSCIDAGEVLSITKRRSSAKLHKAGFGTRKRKLVPGTKTAK